MLLSVKQNDAKSSKRTNCDCLGTETETEYQWHEKMSRILCECPQRQVKELSCDVVHVISINFDIDIVTPGILLGILPLFQCLSKCKSDSSTLRSESIYKYKRRRCWLWWGNRLYQGLRRFLTDFVLRVMPSGNCSQVPCLVQVGWEPWLCRLWSSELLQGIYSDCCTAHKNTTAGHQFTVSNISICKV